ncbi:hypothetical protein AgCh_034837 [Apium graveolens]
MGIENGKWATLVWPHGKENGIWVFQYGPWESHGQGEKIEREFKVVFRGRNRVLGGCRNMVSGSRTTVTIGGSHGCRRPDGDVTGRAMIVGGGRLEKIMDMEAEVTLYIHHGGEFVHKSGLKYYKGEDIGGESEKDEKLEDIGGEREKDEENKESESDGGSEESVDESEAEEDSEDDDYNVNLSDCDEERNEVMQRKKKVYAHKINPTQSTLNDLTIPLSTLTNQTTVKDKKKELMTDEIKGWESEYDSDSYKIGGKESSDCSDNEA